MVILILVLLIYTLLHLTSVQNWLVNQATAVLSDKLHTKVKVEHVDFSFFNKLEVEGILVEDQKKDTLLYAGNATISISDWFFFKDKPVLHNIGLEDVSINFKRTDSVWNYQFLADYFSSPSNDTTSKKKSKDFEIDLKKLALKNIRFNQIDEWIGTDMKIGLKNLDLNAENFDLKNKKILLSAIDIDQPLFFQNDYTGNREKLHILKKKKKQTLTVDPFKWNSAGWIVDVKDLHINNGSLQIERESDRAPYTDRFDGDHFTFGAITGDLKDLHFEKDTLLSNINLATKERSGFEAKHLKALLKFTPDAMEFKHLDLETNNSKLGNYYVMKYKDFEDDMSSFLHNVTLEGNFENSTISSDDIAFFAPALKNWKRKFTVNGKATGTIDNMTAKQMEIKSGNSYLNGSINLSGLPDLEETFIDLKAKELKTDYKDIVSIFPTLKKIQQPDLSKLGNIEFQGNFTGFLNDFVTYATVNTDLGMVKLDINLKLPEKNPIVYNGKISTAGFALGKFINNNRLGNIVFDASVNGSGISVNETKAKVDGTVKSIEFNNYNFQNIAVKGDFSKKLFNGSVNIDDPNLTIHNLTGTVNLNNKEPKLNFDADLISSNSQKLKLTSDEYNLSGKFNLNFTGNDIDNFAGTAKVYNASLLHAGQPLSFDSLVLNSQIADGKKILSLQSNEADVKIVGNFKIMELQKAFQLFLSNYYPSYITKTSKPLTDQNFSFSIKTKEIENYIRLFDKNLSGFNNSTIEGNIKLKENELNINANVPFFSYERKKFNNIVLEGKGNLDTLVAKIDADDIVINDSLHLPSTKLLIVTHNDLSNVSINTSASKTLGNASLNAQVRTKKDGVDIHFYPSSFIVNDKKWEIEKDGELTITNSQVIANEIRIIQGNQQISISTEPSELFNSNDILIGLKKINIDDVTPFLFKDPHLEGLVTGTAKIENPFAKPIIEYDLKAESFKLENDSIGTVTAKGNFSMASGIVRFIAESDNSKNKFKIEGNVNAKDTTGNQANISFNTENFDLAILNNYLGGVFADIKGSVNTSDLKVSGNLNNLSLTGTANINEGSLIVDYTKCKYSFSNESVIFNPDEIDFGTIQLRDTLNHTATLSGKMYHHFFRNFRFDDIRFESPRLLVLNTTKKDNNEFYGKVIGSAKMRLNGPVENMRMDIEGEPSKKDSSHIYITSGSSVENDEIDYINFVQFGKEMAKTSVGKLSTSILVDMNLTANTNCKIDVILDETTGDIIKGVGNGLLNIKVGNKEPLSIRGRYDITKGEYTFNFQTFLKKPFTLNSGSIVWSGDPFLANINILAEYLAKNVDLTNISTDLRKKSDIRVVSHLTETLLKPKISFQFQLPDNSELKNDFVISKKLQEFTYDENEMNKQVTSLLLFNSFINNNQTFLNAGSGYSVLSNTIGGVISGALSNSFNKLLQKILNDNTISFNVDLNSNIDLQSKVAKLQGAAKATITKAFFDNRLIVTIGGNFDYNNPYTFTTTGKNTNVLITPDVTAEWILTKDGRVRIVGFNQTNIDLIGQRNRTGVKLTYRKDVDKLSEIFRSK